MVLHRALTRGLVALAAVLAMVLVAPSARVGAADEPVYDPRVQAALDLLDANPATDQLRAVLENNQVDVHFLPMAPGLYARYSLARHVIEIDDRWIDSDTVTLAAVIAHEATHAQDAVSGYLASGGVSACIDSEVRAFRTSALFWISIFGPQGKIDPANDLEQQLNEIADKQLHDPQQLEDLIRQTYSQQCSP